MKQKSDISKKEKDGGILKIYYDYLIIICLADNQYSALQYLTSNKLNICE